MLVRIVIGCVLSSAVPLAPAFHRDSGNRSRPETRLPASHRWAREDIIKAQRALAPMLCCNPRSCAAASLVGHGLWDFCRRGVKIVPCEVGRGHSQIHGAVLAPCRAQRHERRCRRALRQILRQPGTNQSAPTCGQSLRHVPPLLAPLSAFCGAQHSRFHCLYRARRQSS